MDKRFRIVMIPVKGDEEFADAIAPDPNAALGLVANKHNWIGKPRTFKVFDISAQGEAPTDAVPVLVFQAEE
jgi:hypothetical protein